ncbi:unnamed protein product, partial [Phaeothamnion confervicola]
DVAYLAAGIVVYFFRKSTPPFAYQTLIRMFCQTGGRANDFLSSLISRIDPPVQ